MAVFHDVLEDCEFDRLAGEGFTAEIIEALRSVTKVDGEEYDHFVRCAAANPAGRWDYARRRCEVCAETAKRVTSCRPEPH